MSISKGIDEPKCPRCHSDGRQGRGEISLLNGTVRSEAGDFSAQSFNRAQPHFLTPSCGSARNDTAAWKHRFMGKGMNSKSTAPPSTCHPERQRRILVHGVSMPDGIKYRSAEALHVSHLISIRCHFDGRELSGEISLLNGTVRNEAGDFSAQSFNRAQPHFLTPSCGSARNDTAAGRLHFFRNKKTATESIHDSLLKPEISESQCPWYP